MPMESIDLCQFVDSQTGTPLHRTRVAVKTGEAAMKNPDPLWDIL